MTVYLRLTGGRRREAGCMAEDRVPDNGTVDSTLRRVSIVMTILAASVVVLTWLFGTVVTTGEVRALTLRNAASIVVMQGRYEAQQEQLSEMRTDLKWIRQAIEKADRGGMR